jgi:Flp pilus assembly pilin Flp
MPTRQKGGKFKMWQRLFELAEDLSRLYKVEEGQTIVEYAMIIVLIALAVFASTPSITSAIVSVFTATSSRIVVP